MDVDCQPPCGHRRRVPGLRFAGAVPAACAGQHCRGRHRRHGVPNRRREGRYGGLRLDAAGRDAADLRSRRVNDTSEVTQPFTTTLRHSINACLELFEESGVTNVRLHQGDYAQQTTYELDPVDQAKAFADAINSISKNLLFALAVFFVDVLQPFFKRNIQKG